LEPISEAELLATSVISDDDEDDVEDKHELEAKSVDSDEQLKAEELVFAPLATPPDAEVKKSLFTAFSKLKNLIWVKRQSRGETGEVTFSRQKNENACNSSAKE